MSALYYVGQIDHIHILSIALELAIAMEANAGKPFQMQIILIYSPHWPPLQASSSLILRIRIWSTVFTTSPLCSDR